MENASRPDCPHLFVYGTLRPGAAHRMAKWLAQRSEGVVRARVAGRLYDLGAFPGMLPAAGNEDWVHGELLTVHDIAQTLPVLDGYETGEDAEFQRKLTEAICESGEPVRCWVYYYRGAVDEACRIASGDYLSQGRLRAP